MTLWDWNFALEALPMLGKGLLVTLQVTFTATAIFLLLGLVTVSYTHLTLPTSDLV